MRVVACCFGCGDELDEADDFGQELCGWCRQEADLEELAARMVVDWKKEEEEMAKKKTTEKVEKREIGPGSVVSLKSDPSFTFTVELVEDGQAHCWWVGEDVTVQFMQMPLAILRLEEEDDADGDEEG